MEQWQRDYIKKNGPFLLENTGYSIFLLAHLEAHDVLSSCDIDAIEGKLTKHDKISAIYESAKRKWDGYKNLILALKAAEENTVARRLEEGYPPGHAIRTPVQENDEVDSDTLDPTTYDANDPDPNIPAEVLDFINSTKKLNVIVDRPARSMKLDNLVDSYNLPIADKGLALILNIAKFENEVKFPRREGAIHDVRNLTNLLTKLNYELYPESEDEREKESKTRLDIRKHISVFKKRCEIVEPASIIVFIGSHGIHPNKIITSDPPYDKDGKKVPVTLDLYEDIVSKFYDANCQRAEDKTFYLKGKPKIFLVQACQTFSRLLRDGEEKMEPMITDAIVCTAAIPGAPAYNDVFKGAWFIHCFTYMVMKNAKHKSLQEILEMVKQMLKKIKGVAGTEQVPSIIDHELKKLYLPIRP